jgi:hypothetical protein
MSSNLSSILNQQILIEAIMVGVATLIVGMIGLNLLIKRDKIQNEEQKHPKGLELTFFLTGVFLHLFFEIIGLNKWYCDKKCNTK